MTPKAIVLVAAISLVSVRAGPQCPSQACPDNEVHTECLTPCGDSCKSKFGPIACTDNCLGPGCVCAEGYLRDPRSNLCTKADSCPTKEEWNYDLNQPVLQELSSGQCVCPGRNEAWGSSNTCFEGCYDPNIAVKCIGETTTGCFCQKDYCRKTEKSSCTRGQPRIQPVPQAC